MILNLEEARSALSLQGASKTGVEIHQLRVLRSTDALIERMLGWSFSEVVATHEIDGEGIPELSLPVRNIRSVLSVELGRTSPSDITADVEFDNAAGIAHTKQSVSGRFSGSVFPDGWRNVIFTDLASGYLKKATKTEALPAFTDITGNVVTFGSDPSASVTDLVGRFFRRDADDTNEGVEILSVDATAMTILLYEDYGTDDAVGGACSVETVRVDGQADIKGAAAELFIKAWLDFSEGRIGLVSKTFEGGSEGVRIDQKGIPSTVNLVIEYHADLSFG